MAGSEQEMQDFMVIPMETRIKQILNIVVIILVVLWLLNVFGVLSGGLPVIHVGNP